MSKKLPVYTCHKKVRAGQIRGVGTGTLIIKGGIIRVVSQAWLNKHQPEIGGYFVVYEDGYTSYSPAKAFEDGYTKD